MLFKLPKCIIIGEAQLNKSKLHVCFIGGRCSGLMVNVLDSGASALGLSLSGDTVFRSWARHFTHNASLITQVYKWVPVNLMLGGNPSILSRGE